MKITEIIVSAGRTFNDPNERFSNYRPSVTLKATLEDGESGDQITKNLQDRAEMLVEENKKRLLEISDKRAKREDEIYKMEMEIERLRNEELPF